MSDKEMDDPTPAQADGPTHVLDCVCDDKGRDPDCYPATQADAPAAETCATCARPQATEADYERYAEGEGVHLCWAYPSETCDAKPPARDVPSADHARAWAGRFGPNGGSPDHGERRDLEKYLLSVADYFDRLAAEEGR